MNTSLKIREHQVKRTWLENLYKLQAIHTPLTQYSHKHNQYIFKHLMKNEFMPHSQIYWCLQLQSFQTPQVKTLKGQEKNN